MKNYSAQQFFLHTVSSRSIATADCTKLSENDIIDLHDACMTVGSHYVTVHSLEQGRALIKTLLSSLSCYRNVAVLSIDFDIVPYDYFVHDICRFLSHNHQLYDQIDQYFIYHFEADFMWIEMSEQLRASTWFNSFLDNCSKFNIHKKIPIFIIEAAY